jgi:sugar lactone lactonase YvrE
LSSLDSQISSELVLRRAPMVELVLDVRAELGENPIWDDRRHRLLFVDIMRGHVHEFDPRSGSDRVVEFPWPVGAVALQENGDWLLAAARGFYSATPETGETRLIAQVEADRPANRMNDGYVDARGRFWAGTMNMHDAPNQGALYRLDPDGAVSLMLSGASISNGIDWSPDNRTVYYVDTPTGRIDAVDFDLERGALGRRRSFAEIPSDAGYPDGLVVDADGGVWVCLWQGGAVRRYDPSGRLDTIIPVPATQVTKCAFGGAALDELFISTAWIGLSDEERTEQPLAGGLFHCRPGFTGRAANRFRLFPSEDPR